MGFFTFPSYPCIKVLVPASLLGGIPSSYSTAMVMRFKANPVSACTRGIGNSLMYAVKYSDSVYLVSPSNRSSLEKEIVAIKAFWIE